MIRIIQEALTNVRKHSRARCVQVRIGIYNQSLTVSITDDGIGFYLPSAKGHFGLATMKERAESVGGGLTVDSRPGIGTQVELWLPVIQNNAAGIKNTLITNTPN
jgi:signal transduction histidine kinase